MIFPLILTFKGRNFLYDPCGRAFVDLPAVTVSETGHELKLTTFTHLYLTITDQLCATAHEAPSGVWVCGSDGVLVLDEKNTVDWSMVEKSDIVAFTIPVSSDFATQHGVYKLNKQVIINCFISFENHTGKVYCKCI